MPWMVSRRIFDISCNKEYFDSLLKAVPAYNNALKISGFNENIHFTSTPPPRRSRNKKIIWLNPPYSVNVKTNIGRIFYVSLTSTSRDIINTASYLIETISRSNTVACQISSSETITPVF